MAKFDSYNIASNNSYSLTSPVIAFNGASYTVKFRMFVSGQSSTGDRLEVFYNTTNTLTGATSLGSVERRLLFSDNQPGWYTYIFEIPGTPTGNGYISFVGTSGYGYSFDIDEVVVGVNNTCAPSAIVNVSSISNSGGFASWSDTGVSNYEYVVDNTNADPLSSATKTTTSIYAAQISGLTSNTSYFLHVRSSCSSTSKGEWKTVAFKTLRVPNNDICANAILLTPSSRFDDNYTTGTNLGSNTSSGFSTICSTSINSDVWYKAVVPASGSLTFETAAVSESTLTNTLIGVYSGTCGSLNQIICNGNGSIATNYGKAIITGRTPGEVVYIGVWNTNYSTTNGEFKIEAYDASLVPANDLCTGAITLKKGTNFAQSAVLGNTLGATTGSTNLTCNLSGVNDVWYKVVVPASGSLRLETQPIAGSKLTNTLMGIYSGTCNSLTELGCSKFVGYNSNFSLSDITGRTPGETLYINIYSYAYSPDGEFKVAAYDIPTPLVNDNCNGAVLLTVGNNFNNHAEIGTTLNALSPATSTSCGSNFDVWYKAVIPASGSLTIETASVSGSALADTQMEVFSGSCGSLTNIDCNDDISSGSNNFSKISLTARTPGEIIYIAICNYSSDDLKNGEFKVAAYDASISLATNTFDLSKFSFYPNPVDDFLNLDYSESISTVEVINILGQTVLIKNANSDNRQINLSSLPSGNYFVKLTSGSLTQTIKIIKK